MNKNKIKIDSFFEKYSTEYSNENYNKKINRFMFLRLNTIINFVQKNFRNKNIKILDLGCGSGEVTLELAKLGYSGDALDNSKGMLKICQNKLSNFNWNIFLGEAQNTNFENETYDLIIASGLIEYYPNDDILLKEIDRILKKNGHLIINVSNKKGYSTSLNTISYFFKQNFLFKYIKKKLFRFNYGVVNFSVRKHNIESFKNTLNNFNLKVFDEKYVGFSLFPAPLLLFSFITNKVDNKLEILSETKLKNLELLT